jgi:hypothetical protein
VDQRHRKRRKPHLFSDEKGTAEAVPFSFQADDDDTGREQTAYEILTKTAR